MAKSVRGGMVCLALLFASGGSSAALAQTAPEGWSAMPAVDRLEALTAAPKADRPVTVQLLGYGEPGDGGGGLVRWDPDSRERIDPCAVYAHRDGGRGRWRRVPTGAPVNVRQCGAGPRARPAINQAAFAAALVHGDVVVPEGTYRLGAGPVRIIGKGTRFLGQGRASVLQFEGAQIGVAIGDGTRLGDPETDTDGVEVGRFRITGTGETALKVHDAQRVSLSHVSLEDDRGKERSRWRRGFHFEHTWSSRFTMLDTAGATVTDITYFTDGHYNANYAANWHSASNFARANLWIERAFGSGFHSVTAQGATMGVKIKRGLGLTFTGLWTEGTARPVVFGDTAADTYADSIVIDGAHLAGPYPIHPHTSSAKATLDFERARNIEIVSTVFVDSRDYGRLVEVTFEGGGGSGARATAIVNRDGSVAGLVLLNRGRGYRGAPTVTLTPGRDGNGRRLSRGRGAKAVAQVTGGGVTGLTLTDPGRGYQSDPITPVPILYDIAYGVTIRAPSWTDGITGQPGALWPFVTRTARAPGATNGGIAIVQDRTTFTATGGLNAHFRKADGYQHRHHLVWTGPDGVQRSEAVTPVPYR
ncbi:MAG: hypothetical protein ACFB6R_02515 [Alphaproteobacteria bacterium]